MEKLPLSKILIVKKTKTTKQMMSKYLLVIYFRTNYHLNQIYLQNFSQIFSFNSKSKIYFFQFQLTLYILNICGPTITLSDVNCGAHRAPSCGDCILNPALARWLWFSWCSGGDCHWDQRLNLCVDPGM